MARQTQTHAVGLNEPSHGGDAAGDATMDLAEGPEVHYQMTT